MSKTTDAIIDQMNKSHSRLWEVIQYSCHTSDISNGYQQIYKDEITAIAKWLIKEMRNKDMDQETRNSVYRLLIDEASKVGEIELDY